MNFDNRLGNRRFIVLDIVFHSGSLNYDQGTSNYQELKKITKWDGRPYTLVSRYALRYSILEAMREMYDGNEVIVPGNKLRRASKQSGVENLEGASEGGEVKKNEEKGVIQPSEELLLNGEISKYPELDLFGYLITTTEPQNFREAPVKISHAISMTPYNYDAHFCANIGLARRMVEAGKEDKLEPNPFVVEEHHTYYIYTVVIDVERIGTYEVYLSDKYEVEEIEKNKKVIIREKKNEREKKERKQKQEETEKVYEISVDKGNLEKIEVEKKNNVSILRYILKGEEKKKRIENLIRAILRLNRSIKARSEALQPKLLVLGIYINKPYKTYKDCILLSSSYEEIYEESVERKDEQSVKVIRRVVKLERPTFKIVGIPESEEPQKLEEDEVLRKIYPNENSTKTNTKTNGLESCEEKEKVYIFYSPEVNVEVTYNKTTEKQEVQQKHQKK